MDEFESTWFFPWRPKQISQHFQSINALATYSQKCAEAFQILFHNVDTPREARHEQV
jgi:hypothetical protein